MAFDPVSAAFDFGGKLLDHFFPNPAEKAAAAQKLMEMQQSGELAKMAQDSQIMQAQADINKVEAANTNMFVAGWRPAVGWVCVAGLAFAIFSPLLTWVASLAGHPVVVPTVPMDALMSLLIGMLGLGGMRTIEKLNNAQGNH